MTASMPDLTKLANWWKLDENGGTAYDSNENMHLTQHSGTIPRGNGKVGYCRNFERDTTHYLKSSNRGFSNSPSYHWTTGMWIKPETINKLQYLWYADNTFYIRINADGTLESALVDTYNLSSGLSDLIPIKRTTPLVVATWYFISVSYSGDGNENNIFSLRVNNEAPITTQLSLSVGSADELFIGADNTPANHYDGKLDEMFIFRNAFTDDEHAWLYNGGEGVSYYDLQQGGFVTMF